ncbi:MAG TPA: hypothetical protein DCQ41_00120 [Cryomorphaceae bacterium]|nr:hypothetical protein [Cryomorphaceae bacterium]
MKRVLLIIAFLGTLAAEAQEFKGHYGVGLAIGEPSGFSIKKFINNGEAFQYTLGYSTVKDQEGVNIGADFLLHNYDFITAEKGKIPFYYGAGIHLRSYNDMGNQVYARVPLGLAYEVSDLPLDIFFEFAPGIAVIPQPSLVTNFALGGRFYFDFNKARRAAEKRI